MATTRQKYVDKCNEVYEAKPKYQNGASDLNECDCIGMTKYGLRANGVKISTTGTNHSFRSDVKDTSEIGSANDLSFGDVVFKAYEPGDKGYNLPAKYQPGGSEYNGDLRDYYHIGTVRSVNPLEIIHMTSPTAKVDTKVGTWRFRASLKDQYISDSPEPEQPQPEPPTPPVPVTEIAIVTSQNGKPVKMRNRPSRKCNLYWEIPVGTEVVVKEKDIQSDGTVWSKIVYTGITGYMMQEFLKFGDEEPTETLWTVHVPHLTEDQAQALIAQFPGSYMTSE